MKKLYLVALFSLFGINTFAQQNGSIKAVIFDSISKRPVPYATVSLLQRSDSSLVSFSLTDESGKFEFNKLRNGNYRLLVTHNQYHNSNTFVSVADSNRNIDLGNIFVQDVAKTLSELVVKSEAPPVTLINDTVQYNAGSFKTAPNANVEQLLKKLPGVKVEKDGTIKAQGEKVSRVLVDGKEFFGDDPKLATKNLPADAVDKVQVYDRQSEQAQLTGFDDGNYEKTINLKLKKDRKKGMFGKAAAGGGTGDRYEGKFNANSFKGARQLSVIGMANNNNAEGFSFMDILNFTGELRRMQQNNGNMNINISPQDMAAYGGTAGNNNNIRTIRGGGVNYNNIAGTKLDLQSNYFYNFYNPVTESNIQQKFFLPDSSYLYKQDAVINSSGNTHRFNLNALFQIDSMNSIRVTPLLSYQKNNNRSNSRYQTIDDKNALINDGAGNSIANNEGYSFRNELLYRLKTKKRGRTFSLSFTTTLNESKGNGNLSSMNDFYDPAGPLVGRDTINQQYSSDADLKGYTARVAYTEPLFRRSLLEFSIARSDTRNQSAKTTYDYDKQSGKHDILNRQLSNDFENRYEYNNAGLRMRTQKKKYNYTFGLIFQQSGLKGYVINSAALDSVVGKTFKNLLPSARFQYAFSKFKRFSFNYATSTRQPDITQMQPVADNSNPLNIKIGNPNLKQEYNHSFQSNLEWVNPYRNRNLFVFLSAQLIHNRIVNSDSINSLGIKTTTPVNVNGSYFINGGISYSVPVKFLKSNIEISTNMGYNEGRQFINGIKNKTRALSLSPQLNIDMNPTQKIAVSLRAMLSYSATKYSLQQKLDAEFYQQEYSAAVEWEMPYRFFFSTDFTYTIYNQPSSGFTTKLPLWNASISRQLLRFNRGEIKLGVVDLLNRNIGIGRFAEQNYVEDSRFKTLRRFFMLSFTYSLSKTGLNNAGGVQFKTR